MDLDRIDRELTKLFQSLELLGAAANSAGSQPICQVHIDPLASYQRAIDFISLANKYDIRLFFTHLAPEVANPLHAK